MLRRLHSRIIGLGSVCGLPPSPPAEVFLKSLPPPQEVDPAKYERFQQEERGRGAAAAERAPHIRQRAPEPFFDVVAGAAGHKHVALLTREGSLITFGENRYGQTAAPKKDEEGAVEDGAGLRAPSFTLTSPSLSAASSAGAQSENPDWAPLYIDLGDSFPPRGPSVAPAQVSCGSNYTIVYQPGGRRVLSFGNNHVGQLGVGHKNRIDSERGFEEWDPTAPWWPSSRDSVIARVASGYNHSILQLSCGALFSFGSNTWGELSTGDTVSPMHPTRITYFERKGQTVRKASAGNSFTLFLTREGRVYGCGATNFGQLPSNAFEPVPLPLLRSYVENGTEPVAGSGSAHKLIRMKDIACVGNLAAFVSVGDEVFVQGSLPEYGVATHAPRLTIIDQGAAVETLQERMLQLGWPEDAVRAPKGFAVAGLVAGPSTLLVRFANGCVGAIGANSEGQLHNVTKNIHGRAVNLAPSFSSTGLLPVFAPRPRAPLGGDSAGESDALFLCGSGFTLLVDNDEVYPVREQVRPIELPPGRAAVAARRMPESTRGAAGARGEHGGSRDPQAMTRRQRLVSSLK